MVEARSESTKPWRVVFAAAAIYNIGFGAWAILRPMDFFYWFELHAPRYVFLWSCLGMVIGVYGLGYAYIAWKPQRGDVLAMLGLLGKVLGPIGWWWSVRSGDIPPRTFPMILFNDLIWWFPFTWYLLRNVRNHRVILAMLIVFVHVVASVTLIMAQPGTEAEPVAELRRTFIDGHMASWVLCWLLWVCGSLGLYVFFILWAGALRKCGGSMTLLIAACGLCAVGLSLDIINEYTAIVALTDAHIDLEAFAIAARRATVFGAGFANAIYCICGLTMSVISWRVRFQRGWLAMLALVMWTCGLVLSAAAFADRGELMAVFGGGLMTLFIPWVMLTGWQFRSDASPLNRDAA